MTDAPLVAGVHHVKLPVSDLQRSLEWYRTVLGFEPQLEFRDRHDGVLRGVSGDVPGDPPVPLALRENPAAATGIAGFDPVSFGVTDLSTMQSWAQRLDDLGMPHSPVIAATFGWLLIFHDPDGLELHFYSWAPHELTDDQRGGTGPIVTPIRER